MLALRTRAKVIYNNYYHWFPTRTGVLSIVFPYWLPYWLCPGLLSSFFIILIIFAVFSTLLCYASLHSWYCLLIDHYLWHVVGFTFWQALLSSWLTVFLAVALARALYYCHFPGRALIIRFCTIILALPVLVGVLGIISIFGQQGWLAHLCTWLHVRYNFSPYGFGGILLANIFFNLPLATRLLLQALESIPVEICRLAAQLNMSSSQFFCLVEWFYLRRQLLPAAALIFIICFTSFTIVLVLGGNPRNTTIELAIYQALSYDLNVSHAALLALLQVFCCLSLVLPSQHIVNALPIEPFRHTPWYNQHNSFTNKLAHGLIIMAAVLFLLPPLLAVLFDGINSHLFVVLAQRSLWQALFISLGIAVTAGLLCLLLTSMLLWSSRELILRQYRFSAQLLNLSGMVIMTMPSIVLTTGFFLLTMNNDIGLPLVALVVILTNALMAIPYALKVLESPMLDIAERYSHLCILLNITGFNRIRLVEWRALRQPLGRALAFSCVLSLGDFDVVALFGNENFHTLPLYLYQQMGSYHYQDGAVTALLLLLLYLIIFTIIEKLSGFSDKNGKVG